MHILIWVTIIIIHNLKKCDNIVMFLLYKLQFNQDASMLMAQLTFKMFYLVMQHQRQILLLYKNLQMQKQC